jgi:hypothetical protein
MDGDIGLASNRVKLDMLGWWVTDLSPSFYPKLGPSLLSATRDIAEQRSRHAANIVSRKTTQTNVRQQGE